MIIKPLNYLIFALMVFIISVIVFPFPIRLLEMYSAAGEYDLASAEAAKMLAAEGETRPAINFMADQAAAEGDPELLVHYLLRLGRVSINKPHNYQRLADVYMWMGDPDMAINSLESKLTLRPNDPKALMALTGLYQTMDRPRELVRIIQMRLDSSPGDIELMRYLASLYSLLGEFKQEIKLYRALLKLAPKDHSNLLRLGELLSATSQKEQGFKEFSAMLNKNPGNRTAARALLTMIIANADQAAWQRLNPLISRAMGGLSNLLDHVSLISLANGRAGFGAWMVSGLATARPDNLWAYELAVKLYRSANQLNQAVAFMRRLSAAHPGNTDLLTQLADLQLETDNIPGAYEALEKIVRLRPESSKAWQRFIQIANWTSRPHDLLAAYQLRLEYHPDDAKALKNVAMLAEQAGDYQLAKDSLIRLARHQEIKDLKGRLQSLDEKIKPQVEVASRPESTEAKEVMQPGEPAPAQATQIAQKPKEPAQRQVTQKTQEPVEPALTQAQTTHKPQEPELPQDLGALRAMLKKAPDDRRLLRHYLKVASYTPLSRADLAYLDGLTRRTSDQETLSKIGKALIAGDKVPQAIPVFEKLAALRPKDKGLRRDLAKYYSWTGKPEKQARTLMQLAVLEPDNPKLRREIFDLASSSGLHDLALKAAAWLNKRGKLDPAGQMTLAEAYLAQKQPQKALEICRKIMAQKPDAKLLARAGEMALTLRRPRLARALLTQASLKGQGHYKHLKQLAIAEMALGRAEKAVAILQSYTRRFRDYEAHYILGEYLNSLGRRKEAQREFMQAQALMSGPRKVAQP